MAILKDRLRELRKANNYTQEDISRYLGITESAYGYYEQGRNEPSINTLKRLAKKYGVDISYIIGENNQKESSINVAGQAIELSSEEIKVFQEMKKHPDFAVMFHDLAKDPEKKIKTLIRMWKVIKEDLEE